MLVETHVRDTSNHDRQEAESSGPEWVVGMTSKAPSKLLPPAGLTSSLHSPQNSRQVGHSDVSLCVCVCVYVHTRAEARGQCHLSVTSHLVLWDKVSHRLGVCPLGWFGQPQASVIPSAFFSPRCWTNNHFTDWAISPTSLIWVTPGRELCSEASMCVLTALSDWWFPLLP